MDILSIQTFLYIFHEITRDFKDGISFLLYVRRKKYGT